MKSIHITSLVILASIFIIACQPQEHATLNYRSLNYDTSHIMIFDWDTIDLSFPNNSSPLPLKQEDLAVVDSLLKNAIDSFNTNISPGLYKAFGGQFPLDSLTIQQKKYKYQLLPFKDVNGQRIIYVIGYSTEFPEWKKKIVPGRLHYGFTRLYLTINLSEKSRDNLRSGDFG